MRRRLQRWRQVRLRWRRPTRSPSRRRKPRRCPASPSPPRVSTRRAARSSPASARRVTNSRPASSPPSRRASNAPLNQVLLRAPGVVQDSFGQIHVRGDHSNVQYRLDGMQLPEGLSLFTNALTTRSAHSLSLITGALPAQYGFRQAGVVDITLKSGTTDPGAEATMTGRLAQLPAAGLFLRRPHRAGRLFLHRPVPPQRRRHRESDGVRHADP